MEAPAFEPLNHHPRAIRLVRIDGLDERGYLKLVTRNTILGVENHFIAVSYVWGIEDPTYTVIVNGNHHYLRPNIWSFLAAAHEAKTEQEMWIDSVCIDQSNIQEKNRQIPIMGDIFTSAERVIGWLHGNNMTHTDPASVEVVRAISDGLMIQFDNIQPVMKLALLRLIGHEYWSRLWIVQELELRPEIAAIWWHGHEIEWKRLKHFVLMACDGLMTPENRLDAELQKTLVRAPGQTFPIFDFCRKDQRRALPRLIDVIIRYANHACSVNHDRVFGLLAFTPEARNFTTLYEESHLSLMARVLQVSKQFPTEDETQKLCQILSVRPESVEIEAVQKIRLTSLNRTLEQNELVLGYIPGAHLYMLLGSSSELHAKHRASARGDELGFLCFVDRLVSSDCLVPVRPVPCINDLQESNKLRFHHRGYDRSIHVTASGSSLHTILSQHYYWKVAAKTSSDKVVQVTLDSLFETLMDRTFDNIYVQTTQPLEHFPDVPPSVYRPPIGQQNKWSIK